MVAPLIWFDMLTAGRIYLSTNGVYLSAHPRIKYGAGSELV